MRVIRILNHVLISLFAVSSGLFKVIGGAADIDVFGKMGMTATAVAIFGAVQAAAGLGLQFGRTSRVAAILLVLCNVLATTGLFVAGIVPFGVVSILFVAMAAWELSWPGWRGGLATAQA